MGSRAPREAWPPADLQRCSHLDVPDDQSPLWDGASAYNGVRHKPAEAGWARLVCARFQHVEPPPEDPFGEHSLLRRATMEMLA